MLEAMDCTQRMSDALKRVILEATHIKPPRRITSLNLLTAFERHDWNVYEMREVIADMELSLTFTEDAVGIVGEGKDAELEAVQSIDNLVVEYMERMPNQEPELFSIQDAAEYLGISRSQMKKYIHPVNRVGGRIVGNSRIFTRRELDKFNAVERRPVGRPSAEDSE